MSDLLQKANSLNHHLNRILRLPTNISYDPKNQAFKHHAQGSPEWAKFLFHNISALKANLLVIAWPTLWMLLYPDSMRRTHKVILLLDMMIMIPVSCLVFLLLIYDGQEFAIAANWSLSTQQKYTFMPRKNSRQDLVFLLHSGKVRV